MLKCICISIQNKVLKMIDIPQNWIVALAIVIGTAIFAKIVSSSLAKSWEEKLLAKGLGRRKQEPMLKIVRRIIISLIILIGLYSAASILFPGIGAATTGLIVGAGFFGIVVGLAAQDTIGNILSGISIAISKPFKIGDAVLLRDEYGNVEDITLRHTIIRLWDNRRTVIPNSVLNREVIINYSIRDPKMLVKVEVPVSYDSDVQKASKIMIEEAKKNPNCLKDMVPVVSILDFGDLGMKMRLLAMAQDQPTAFGTACQLREAIKRRFDKAGIEFARRYTIIRKAGKKT